MTWSDGTNPPASSRSTIPSNSREFQLHMEFTYCDGEEKSEAVVYEGASADILSHTICMEDRSKLHIQNSNLQLIDQPDLSNLPKTPLDNKNKVGTGLTLQESQALALPRTLSPMQQETMIWHPRLYHLPFRILFCLISMGFLPKRLLGCRNNPLLCVACQCGAAHRRTWRTKGNESGLIRRPEKTIPGDDVSVDQIVSDQPALITQMPGFLTC